MYGGGVQATSFLADFSIDTISRRENSREGTFQSTADFRHCSLARHVVHGFLAGKRCAALLYKFGRRRR
jgi:hypothetical protein